MKKLFSLLVIVSCCALISCAGETTTDINAVAEDTEHVCSESCTTGTHNCGEHCGCGDGCTCSEGATCSSKCEIKKKE